MGLYLPNGYLDFDRIRAYNCPFTMIIGGRGIGKTFGALDNCIENDDLFMFLRRTQTQADVISNPAFSPIIPVMTYRGIFGEVETVTKNIGAIYTRDADEAPKILRGYTAALSTFSSVRGFQGSQIGTIIFDEFIPEVHEKLLKHEADAFFNMVETVNRNRELSGDPPVRVWMLSNSNSLYSPILAALGLVTVIEKMMNRDQELYIDRDRGICVILPRNSPISERKSETALYRATRGSAYSEMALANEFAYDDRTDVRSRSLKGLKLIMQVGPCYFYGRQGDSMLYISAHGAGTPGEIYTESEVDLRRFVREHPGFYDRLLRRGVEFENYELKKWLTALYI